MAIFWDGDFWTAKFDRDDHPNYVHLGDELTKMWAVYRLMKNPSKRVSVVRISLNATDEFVFKGGNYLLNNFDRIVDKFEWEGNRFDFDYPDYADADDQEEHQEEDDTGDTTGSDEQ